MLLTGVAAAVVLPASASARSLSCGDVVARNVKLHADLDCTAGGTGGLFVGKAGITIDLNRHSITGAGGADGYEGIENDGYGGVTIKDGEIARFQDDVYLTNAAHTTIRNVALRNDDPGNYNGIYSTYGTGNRFVANSFGRAKYGIYAASGAANTIAGNTFHRPAYAVYTQSESHDQIVGNRSHGFSVTTDAFNSYGDYRTVYRDDRANGGYEGFYVQAPRDVLIAHSTANSNGYAGVYIDGNSPTSGYVATVKHSTASHNAEYGMYAAYGIPSSHNVAVDNDYYNCYMVSCNR